VAVLVVKLLEHVVWLTMVMVRSVVVALLVELLKGEAVEESVLFLKVPVRVLVLKVRNGNWSNWGNWRERLGCNPCGTAREANPLRH